MIHAVFSRPNRGYATIALSPYQSAQGPVLREYRDGRVVIDTGRGELTGLALNRTPSMPAWMPIFGLAY
ncbi:hypothetical protein ACDP63_15945 [Paracoccus sp. P2]|uniref:Uncharacterized protein n=1 Tax=Paracoccus pantotrophus TaxID=82367 RepID=A0A1I5K8B0_PARPN|nr:hypothetical protein [Paracoccus pantotrophus]MDF3855795.1 hypothetical protein [Paracoccus pantotrophus]QFG35775.1 hypothetical protein ESD82_06360 [Paracoccus pantotrophus]QLH14046.1 hypothetical protein HYQ43_07300 [Paracoccus pantotrophus]RDD97253.1 hypothetical protein DTW92_08830 [Paracoccus pantotrophus]RKS43977.1 hypothetical protein BDE18_2805 [Paracoccus pantotrophus]